MSGKDSKTPMTGDAASRIQSHEAKASGGGVEKAGFASRAQVGHHSFTLQTHLMS